MVFNFAVGDYRLSKPLIQFYNDSAFFIFTIVRFVGSFLKTKKLIIQSEILAFIIAITV